MVFVNSEDITIGELLLINQTSNVSNCFRKYIHFRILETTSGHCKKIKTLVLEANWSQTVTTITNSLQLISGFLGSLDPGSAQVRL